MNSYSVADATKPYTEYDMIRDNTELPELPNVRTRLLYTFLTHSDKSSRHRELYAVVVALAQLGLDTHDLVAETNERKEKDEARARQMRVLAGDYFSSRFYQLLAQSGHVETTGHLSAAICEVNKLKLNLYVCTQQRSLTAGEYMRALADVKKQLYLSFTSLLDDSQQEAWKELLDGFACCEVLLDELLRLESDRGASYGWAFWHLLQTASKEDKHLLRLGGLDAGKQRALLLKYRVPEALHRLLEQEYRLLAERISRLESESLVRELNRICEPFAMALTAKHALEEV